MTEKKAASAPACMTPPFTLPAGLAPSAWFLGPKGENEALLRRLVTSAIDAHLASRRDYAKGDPDMIQVSARTDPAIAATEAALLENLDRLTQALRGSIPLASWRNQSHMYWDTTLPSIAGYFAGMLWNQNNVAPEASPVTTAIEIEVGRQLCTMLGYGNVPEPWGHITCDGSVANAEALWAARNLRYLPAALAAALRSEDALRPARGVVVRTAEDRTHRLVDLDPWSLVNIPVDEALALPARAAKTGGLDEAMVRAALDRWSVQSLGMSGVNRLFPDAPALDEPLVLVPATAHYSWPKGAALLGLGKASVRLIPVDADGRMAMPAFRAALDECLDARRPVLLAVAVLGTTEEGAVDPLAEMLEIRQEYAGLGLAFPIHADAAWGGYFASMLRVPARNAPPDQQRDAFDATPVEAMSDHVLNNFMALTHADSITVDPHKAGYAPYPAGALCYRNGEMRHAIAHTAPVVWHDGRVVGIGVFGIEGSKPGAAATSVALSHATIPTDSSGFGRLLGRCMFNAKRLHAELLALEKSGDPILLVPFNRLPSEKNGGTEAEVAAERRIVTEAIAGWSNDELVHHLNRDPDLKALFRGLGADLTVTAYAFNLRLKSGLNADPVVMNALNEDIYRRLSLDIDRPGVIPTAPMFVTASTFDPASASSMVERMSTRAGLPSGHGHALRFLISTVQNPWLTDTADGNFMPRLMGILRQTALDSAQAVATRYSVDLA